MYKPKRKIRSVFRKLLSFPHMSYLLPPRYESTHLNIPTTTTKKRKVNIHFHHVKTKTKQTRHCIMKTGPGQGVRMHEKETLNHV